MSKEVNEERVPRTVADVKEMLTKHSNGEIQRTIQNCITILQNDHVLADAIRLNLLSERIDIVKPVGWPRSGKTLNDTDMKYILRRMEKYGISSEKKNRICYPNRCQREPLSSYPGLPERPAMGRHGTDSPCPAPLPRCCGGRVHLRGHEDLSARSRQAGVPAGMQI